jgi:hypothetical protein
MGCLFFVVFDDFPEFPDFFTIQRNAILQIPRIHGEKNGFCGVFLPSGRDKSQIADFGI